MDESNSPKSKGSNIKLAATIAVVLITYVMCSSDKSNSAKDVANPSPRSLSAEEITKICAAQAGVPLNNPSHRMTSQEVKEMSECAERYINQSRSGK